jgi:hypothetical protein
LTKKSVRKTKRTKPRNPQTAERKYGVDFTSNTLLGGASDKPRKVRGG